MTAMPEYDANGKRIQLAAWFPELPPTTNKLYYLGTRLKDEARAYRERFRQHLQQNYGHLISEMEEPNEKAKDPNSGELVDVRTRNPNLIYGISLIFYMDCLTSWGDIELPASRKAKFRFQKADLTNRIKFVEDCFKWSLDIDDSLTFWSQQMKVHSPEQQGVYIHYFVMQPEQFGVRRWGG